MKLIINKILNDINNLKIKNIIIIINKINTIILKTIINLIINKLILQILIEIIIKNMRFSNSNENIDIKKLINAIIKK